MPQTIAILTGGTSSEREIALQSAAFVKEQLGDSFTVQLYDVPHELERFLHERSSIDIAIPVFHGVRGEDGTIQGFLKTLDIPFLFSDVPAHAIGMNKAITKDLLLQHGIPTAPYVLLTSTDPLPAFSRPCVIKPIDSGSSVGVTIVKEEKAFVEGIKEGFKWSKTLLIEDCICGREFTVAVIEENGKLVALPVIEIRSKHAFFDLESKYDPALVDELCPAPIEEEQANQLKTLAIQTHQTIGAKHLSRTDVIVDQTGNAWVLEINTIPGQTKHSLLPKAIRASGRELVNVYTDWITKELRS